LSKPLTRILPTLIFYPPSSKPFFLEEKFTPSSPKPFSYFRFGILFTLWSLDPPLNCSSLSRYFVAGWADCLWRFEETTTLFFFLLHGTSIRLFRATYCATPLRQTLECLDSFSSSLSFPPFPFDSELRRGQRPSFHTDIPLPLRRPFAGLSICIPTLIHQYTCFSRVSFSYLQDAVPPISLPSAV